MTCLSLPVDTAPLCELGERGYFHWWMAAPPRPLQCQFVFASKEWLAERWDRL